MIMHSIIRAIATAIIIVAGWAAAASAAEIKLLSVNGVKLVLGELAAAFEQATGQNVTISYGEAGVLRKRIEDGEAFDTAISAAGCHGTAHQARQNRIGQFGQCNTSSIRYGHPQWCTEARYELAGCVQTLTAGCQDDRLH